MKNKVQIAKIVRRFKINLIEKQNFMLDPIISLKDKETDFELGVRVDIQDWDRGFLAGYGACIQDSIKEVIEVLSKTKGKNNGK